MLYPHPARLQRWLRLQQGNALMSVNIGEVSSEFVVGQTAADTASRQEATAPAAEVHKEEVRAIIRELLVEELDRYLRLVVDR